MVNVLVVNHRTLPIIHSYTMSLKNIRIVLVRPMYGGNVGSVCRAMKNMGLSHLTVVSPREEMDYHEARMMALHASDILDNRTIASSVKEAVADCALAAGTTARSGLYRNHAKTPREWMPVLYKSARQNKVAFIFGPEDSGLSNEELAVCTHVIRIPSSKRYASINLAQAVMICCYELYLTADRFKKPKEAHKEASIQMRERMLVMWRDMLEQIGFFDEGKAEHMMMALRRIFARGPMTEADMNIMMGVARQTMWAAKPK